MEWARLTILELTLSKGQVMVFVRSCKNEPEVNVKLKLFIVQRLGSEEISSISTAGGTNNVVTIESCNLLAWSCEPGCEIIPTTWKPSRPAYEYAEEAVGGKIL